MSYPTEPDFVVVKIGDGATPTEVFTALCGILTANVNQTANTSDKFRRDCAKPGAVPTRKIRVNGRQWDVTGSGVINMTQINTFNAALGVRKNYKIEFGVRDGTDSGVLLGTYTGPAVMTATNISMGDDGSAEITLAGEDAITWTAV